MIGLLVLLLFMAGIVFGFMFLEGGDDEEDCTDNDIA